MKKTYTLRLLALCTALNISVPATQAAPQGLLKTLVVTMAALWTVADSASSVTAPKETHDNVPIHELQDGSYILSGYTNSSFTVGLDPFIEKFNPEGQLEWARVIGGVSVDRAESIVELNDGGYLIVGYTESYASADRDIILLNFDSNGQMAEYGAKKIKI